MKIHKSPKVLFFDVNETLLDLSQLKTSVTKVLDGKSELVSVWFNTMLHYSLVSTVSEHYENFDVIGVAALQMVASNAGIDLDMDEAELAIDPILSLKPHPDVVKSLSRLKDAGVKMVSLTNGSKKAVEAQLDNAGLSKYFQKQLSVEDVKKYKPSKDVYNWAAKIMDIAPEDCMLVAAHGWDIAGALWANWRAAFVARPGKQLYPLAPKPEIIEENMELIVNRILEM